MIKAAKLSPSSSLALLLPLGFWALLWFSLAAGDVKQIFEAESLWDFLHLPRADDVGHLPDDPGGKAKNTIFAWTHVR